MRGLTEAAAGSRKEKECRDDRQARQTDLALSLPQNYSGRLWHKERRWLGIGGNAVAFLEATDDT